MSTELINYFSNNVDRLKRKPLPTSIKYDPIVASRYKTKRDYYYHEDPVYRQAVKERYNKNYNENKEDKYIYKVTCDQCDELVFTCEKMKLKDENEEPYILCQRCVKEQLKQLNRLKEYIQKERII